MGFCDAVASAGPYAHNLHLASDRQPHQHLITLVLHAGCSSWRPANSVKALKAKRWLGNLERKSLYTGTASFWSEAAQTRASCICALHHRDCRAQVLSQQPIPAVKTPLSCSAYWLDCIVFTHLQQLRGLTAKCADMSAFLLCNCILDVFLCSIALQYKIQNL